MQDKRVINIKIYVDGKSEEIQKKLFKMGCRWAVSGRMVCYADSPFLYVDEDGMISAGNKMNNFVSKEYREVKADEILAMEKTEAYKSIDGFRPFMKVLVRNHSDEPWDVALFRKDCLVGINGSNTPAYSVVGGEAYLQCILYRGNEHLAFTVTHDKA